MILLEFLVVCIKKQYILFWKRMALICKIIQPCCFSNVQNCVAIFLWKWLLNDIRYVSHDSCSLLCWLDWVSFSFFISLTTFHKIISYNDQYLILGVIEFGEEVTGQNQPTKLLLTSESTVSRWLAHKKVALQSNSEAYNAES